MAVSLSSLLSVKLSIFYIEIAAMHESACSHARDLFKVGGHLALRDATSAIGIVLGESLLECFSSKVGFLAHATERVQHKIESFFSVKETIAVRVVVGPHGINCLLNHCLSLAELVFHTQRVRLYKSEKIIVIDCSAQI